MRPLITLFLCAHLLNAITVNGDEADSRPAQRIELGVRVKEFSSTDIRYLPGSLSEFGEWKAFVLVFTTLDCSIVRRGLPTLRRLESTAISSTIRNFRPMKSTRLCTGHVIEN